MIYCLEFNKPEFLSEDDWRNVREFKGILRETSRLTKKFQNEEKLNGAHVLVMRKSLHDSLSRVTMELINTEQWSIDKDMMHPTRLEVNIDSFNETKKNQKESIV